MKGILYWELCVLIVCGLVHPPVKHGIGFESSVFSSPGQILIEENLPVFHVYELDEPHEPAHLFPLLYPDPMVSRVQP